MNTKERRRFFRINDNLTYAFFTASPSERLTDEVIHERLFSEDAEVYRDLLKHFKHLDEKIAECKLEIEKKNQNLVRYLEHIEAKLEFLAKKALLPIHSHHPRPVNLSLRGIAFYHNKMIQKESKIFMRLDIGEHSESVILHGVVVYCYQQSDSDDHDEIIAEDERSINLPVNPETHNLEGNTYRVAVKFLNVTDDKEKKLQQHLILAQAKTS